MRLRRAICIISYCACTALMAMAQNAPAGSVPQPGPAQSRSSSQQNPPQAQPPSGGTTANAAQQSPGAAGQQNVPNAASCTLTKHEKFQHWIHRTYSPYTFGGVVFDATWAQMWGDWPQYGGGMQGWGKRFGASLADTETRTLFGQFLFPVIFKQDPRYFPSQKRGLFPRAWYATTRVLVARRDADGNTFNSSEFAAVLGTAAVQNAYYPSRDKGFTETMTRFAGGLGSDATSNLLREFWPDIKKAFRKHEPEKMKQMEKKMPGAKKFSELAGPSQ